MPVLLEQDKKIEKFVFSEEYMMCRCLKVTVILSDLGPDCCFSLYSCSLCNHSLCLKTNIFLFLRSSARWFNLLCSLLQWAPWSSQHIQARSPDFIGFWSLNRAYLLQRATNRFSLLQKKKIPTAQEKSAFYFKLQLMYSAPVSWFGLD